MSVDCTVKVLMNSNSSVKAGNIVTGKLIYTVKEESTFSKVTVSMKGYGYLFIKEGKRGNRKTHRKRENYVDIDYIIYKSENGEITPKGTYMKEFHFILPEDIPPSLRITKQLPKHLIHCNIIYYIKVKFEGTGFIHKVYKFKKLVNVKPLIKARFPSDPSTHGNLWKLPQVSWKENTVILKATVDSCVRMAGDNIKLDYEVFNDTNFAIKEVIVNIIEVHTFKAGAGEVKIGEDIKSTEIRNSLITQGNTECKTVDINIPKTLASIEFSNLINRNYFISMTLKLPKHRDNIVFEIPIQITDDGPPPSYWEVLRECSELQDDENDDTAFDDTQSIDSNGNIVTTL